MVGWIGRQRLGPIGVDLGSRSVKLMQFDVDCTRVHEAARWDLPPENDSEPEQREEQIIEAIEKAREGRSFRGRKAVFCLRSRELVVQNIRVSPAEGPELNRLVTTEAVNRIAFPGEEAEIRFISAGDIRQGDAVRREVILLACHRPILQRTLRLAERSDLDPIAVDVEPGALLRCYAKQFRRDDDSDQRRMFIQVGASGTTVLIARGSNPVFVKILNTGGDHLDRSVAEHLKMKPAEATALRRHHGDRRIDQRDPEVTRSLIESIRPVLDRLVSELSMCIRYHSVTFRGRPLIQVIVGGGEANQMLVDWLSERLDVSCELGDPLRDYNTINQMGRPGQWDVAAGLALRQNNRIPSSVT